MDNEVLEEIVEEDVTEDDYEDEEEDELLNMEYETVEEVIMKPQVTLNADRYWTGQYSITGSLIDGIEVDSIPEETDYFKKRCYKLLEDNTWYFDEEKYQSVLSDKKTATQIAEKKAKIVEFEKQIESTDYQIIKCYEYSLVGEELPYDIETLHAERQVIRDSINALETEITNLL